MILACFLNVSVIISVISDDYEDIPISIGIKAANFIFKSDSYQIVPHSTLAERSNGGHIKRKAHGFDIIGPINNFGCIDGVVFGEEPIARIQKMDCEEGPINIVLTANRTSFCVESHGDNVERSVITVNKKHILEALVFGKIRRDTSGKSILAEGQIDRKTDAEPQLNRKMEA